jgi:hypothetical protein
MKNANEVKEQQDRLQKQDLRTNTSLMNNNIEVNGYFEMITNGKQYVTPRVPLEIYTLLRLKLFISKMVKKINNKTPQSVTTKLF